MTEASPSESQAPRFAKITRAEWALILVLMAIQFTHMVDFVIIMPLGDRLMSELQIDTEQFGVIVSAYAIAAGLASFFASLVMDRFDRKWVLLAMYAGFALSTLFCGLADSYELLVLSRTLAGVFGGLAAVAIMAIISDVMPPEKRGRATGAITSSFAVASVVGLPLGLLLAGKYGRGAPFIVLAGLSVLVWLIGYFRIPSIREHLIHRRPNPFREFRKVASNSNHLRAFAFTFFLVMGTFTVASFIAPYLCATNHWTETDLSIIYMVAGVFTLLGMNVIGQLADRVPRLLLFRIFGSAAIVMGLIVTNLPAGPLYVAAIVMSAFMVCATGRFVPAQAMLIGVAEPRNRGAFMSLNTSVQHLATGIAPLIAGYLISKTESGELIGFPIVGIFAAVVSGISLVLGGMLRPAPTALKPIDAQPEPETDAVVEAAVA